MFLANGEKDLNGNRQIGLNGKRLIVESNCQNGYPNFKKHTMKNSGQHGGNFCRLRRHLHHTPQYSSIHSNYRPRTYHVRGQLFQKILTAKIQCSLFVKRHHYKCRVLFFLNQAIHPCNNTRLSLALRGTQYDYLLSTVSNDAPMYAWIMTKPK